MYIDEHGERELPTAEEWDMIIALARESVTQTRSQTGKTQTGILLMYTPSPHTTVLGGTLMYPPTRRQRHHPHRLIRRHISRTIIKVTNSVCFEFVTQLRFDRAFI